VTEGLIKKVTVVGDNIAGDFAHPAGLDFGCKLLQHRISRSVVGRIVLVGQVASANVGVSPAYKDQVADFAGRVGRRIAFNRGAEGEVRAEQFQRRGGREQFHVGSGLEQMVGVALVENLTAWQLCDDNSPEAAARLRLAKQRVDAAAQVGRLRRAWLLRSQFLRARASANNEQQNREVSNAVLNVHWPATGLEEIGDYYFRSRATSLAK
jgi:hypothetical protein